MEDKNGLHFNQKRFAKKTVYKNCMQKLGKKTPIFTQNNNKDSTKTCAHTGPQSLYKLKIW